MSELQRSSAMGDASASFRVLHVGPGHGQRGGIASVLGELAAQRDDFARQGVVFSFFETRGFQRLLGLPMFFLVDVPRFIAALFRGVDAVHFHVSVRGSFVRKYLLFRLARLAGRKTLFHLHAGNFEAFVERSSASMQRAASRFIHECDAVIGVSNAVVEEMRPRRGNRGQVFTIGNTARVLECAVQRSRALLQEPYVAFAGRLTEAKGVGDLLAAIARLKAQGCPVRLRLAGSGDMNRWREMTCAHGIEELVSFAGWLDDDARVAFLRNAALFCMPSHHESFGIATLEAMFARLPVVGTRLGGFLDLVEEGVNGFLVEPGDVEALAHCIRRLVDTPALARRMGNAGFERAHARYSCASIVEQYAQCYRSLR